MPEMSPEEIKTRFERDGFVSPIRVISAEGAQLGIIPTDEALSRAVHFLDALRGER